MKAIAKLNEKHTEKCGIIKWHEIKLNRRIVCKMYFPNHFHPNTFTVEFDTFSLTDIEGHERAFAAVEKELREMYGVDTITDDKNYSWDLLCVFHDPLLDDVTSKDLIIV